VLYKRNIKIRLLLESGILLPNGSCLEGIGHFPDVYIKNSEEDIKNSTDKVIETAIDYLFDNYGIE
jgi:carboxyl-terminal processing protease